MDKPQIKLLYLTVLAVLLTAAGFLYFNTAQAKTPDNDIDCKESAASLKLLGYTLVSCEPLEVYEN